MKHTPSFLIKTLTLLFFASAVTFLVVLKSGCYRAISSELSSVKEDAAKMMEAERDYARLAALGELDTVRVAGSDSFAITSRVVYSPKSAMVFDPDVIFAVLHKDSLPKEFVENYQRLRYEVLNPLRLEYWERVKRKKQKMERQGKPQGLPADGDTEYMGSPKYMRGPIFQLPDSL